MAATKRPRSYEPYLEMDREGIVTLVDPVGPDDDATFTKLGDIAKRRTIDSCPEALWPAYDRLYGDYVRGLEAEREERAELRWMRYAGC